MNKRLLIVDDDVTFCKLLASFLSKNGFEVQTAHHVYEAKQKLSQYHFQFLLLDYRLPDGNGLEILSVAKDLSSDVVAIVMTSFNDIRTAVKAIQLGAKNYIIKPINPDELLMQLSAVEEPDKKSKNISFSSNQFVQGKSELSHKLHEQIKLIASTELSVIIEGESGTGKENIARQIHQYSARANKIFVAVDCGTLTENLAGSELFGHVKGAFTGAIHSKKGKLEDANGGTIFLDEIGNLSYEVQVKLLRVIQERIMTPIGGNKEIKLDIRIIAATNDDLKQSIKKGAFREDLYHRLNEFKIEVPPLRARKEDFLEFVNYFLEDSNTLLNKNVSDLAPDLKDVLLQYDWPGNIRELKNIIRRLVLLSNGPIAQKDALPSEMLADLNQKNPIENVDLKTNQAILERDLIIKTLEEVKYNKSKAAKLLNIDRSTLYAKMEKYNIE